MNNEDKEVQVEAVSVDDAPVVDTPQQESDVEKLTAQLAEMNDKYLRMAAELENTRRRAALDAESRARTRSMGVAEKILPVMDAVDAALKHAPDDAGIQSMARALESAFAQIGIVIAAVGRHRSAAVVELAGHIACAHTEVGAGLGRYGFGRLLLGIVIYVVLVILRISKT